MEYLNLSSYPYYKQEGTVVDATYPFFSCTLLFTAFVFLFEYSLDIRQYLKFLTSKSIPKELDHPLISKDLFNKSISYGKDKFFFGLLESIFTVTESFASLLLGLLPFLWDTSTSFVLSLGLTSSSSSALYSEICTTLLFISLLTLYETLLSLPFSLYKTFIIEQKHGFNKSSLALFLYDKVVTLFLTFLFGIPILSLLITIIRWGGDQFYLYVWLFLFFVSIGMMTLYPTFIAPFFNKYTLLPQDEKSFKQSKNSLYK